MVVQSVSHWVTLDSVSKYDAPNHAPLYQGKINIPVEPEMQKACKSNICRLFNDFSLITSSP